MRRLLISRWTSLRSMASRSQSGASGREAKGWWTGAERGTRKTVPFAREEKVSCSCGGAFHDILVPVLDNGKELIKNDPPARIREFTLQQGKGREAGMV